MSDCTIDSLAPYNPTAEKPWNRERVLHLFRRTCYGVHVSQIDESLSQDPNSLVDSILLQAVNTADLPHPSWSSWSFSNYSDYNVEVVEQTIEHMSGTLESLIGGTLREKMVIFWSGLLVTKRSVYESPSYLFNYHEMLHDKALGNFKDLIMEIGLQPAMLVFLNGALNSGSSPNENYARELLELFTLGEGNSYTQTDIQEISRAMTGYTEIAELGGQITFNIQDHDQGQKIIFGQSGNWNYQDAVNILFQQKGVEIAEYIGGLMYQNFVGAPPDQSTIIQLGESLLNHNFDVFPTIELILKSEAFFDIDSIQSKVKTPLELIIPFWKETGFTYSSETPIFTFSQCLNLGQALFDPPDVSGYPKNLDWINSSTLSGRWGLLLEALNEIETTSPEELRSFAQAIVPNELIWTDPYAITTEIVNYFLPRGLQEQAYYDTATVVFKADVPQNYYDLQEWNLGWSSTAGQQVALLLKHIFKLPEFQLG